MKCFFCVCQAQDSTCHPTSKHSIFFCCIKPGESLSCMEATPLTQPHCALMEVLRWKGNHEIFCHSPPFGCSSVTSMSLSGRRGEETACQSMPFYDVQCGDLRQLFYAIVTLERGVLIYPGVFGPLEPPKPIKLKPFLSQNAIEIRAMYLSPSFPKRRLFASSFDTSCHAQTS